MAMPIVLRGIGGGSSSRKALSRRVRLGGGRRRGQRRSATRTTSPDTVRVRLPRYPTSLVDQCSKRGGVAVLGEPQAADVYPGLTMIRLPLERIGGDVVCLVAGEWSGDGLCSVGVAAR